jgi:predicted short-subunit dehydrogenase-like oxidoreductase (DUF2520 family)
VKSFSIIGAGNLGTNLIHSLVEKQFELKFIYNKSRYGYFSGSVTGDMRLTVREPDFIFICTQESRMQKAVRLAADSGNIEGKIFFHTSNSLTSDELLPLKERGAYTASFSPLQTFAGLSFENGREADIFKDVYFLAEGDEPALALAGEIADSLGARLLIVEKSKKIYFHIAAVCASNFLISILKLSENQLKKAGGSIVERNNEPVDIKVLLPLIHRTLENVKTRGVDASLTGPVKRKETDVIHSHLAHLDGEDSFLYKALTDYLLYSFS